MIRSLSIVLPAFNEEANVATVVRSALDTLDRRCLEGEVLVVDDGSHDGTAMAAGRPGDPRVKVLRHARNRGYGAALRTGLEAARCGHVFFSDADQQFDLRQLARLESWAGGHEIVVGYREARCDPMSRRINAWAWNHLVDGLFHLGVRDIDCAFKLFDRRVFQAVPLRSVGAFINTEILVRARAAGFRIREVPVRHHPRVAGIATGANPRVVLRAFSELARLHGELRAAARDPQIAPA